MKILFDWDGTIAKPDVAQEASTRRFTSLGQTVDPEWLKQALKSHDHYKLNKQLISKYTGITDESLITTIMTDLFRLHYIAVLHEMKNKAVYDGMISVLNKLHSKGHKIFIASTIRSDIIRQSLKELDIEKYFEKVYGNTPDLKYSKKDIVEMAKKNLDGADYMIGDREEDILAGKAVKAKTIYVTWGATGSDFKGKSDYTVEKPEEILKIIVNATDNKK
jgi:phosphoglycolate phosphatase-like HAD superfamily hydrolase